MKTTKFNKILGMTGVALATLGLASCQNEFGDYTYTTPGGNGVSLVKAPDIVAWSGQQTLGGTIQGVSTRTANVNANQWDGVWNCVNNVDEDLTPEDIQNIIKMFEVGHEVENTVIIPWENYFVQQVHKGTSQYYAYDHCEQPDCDHVLAINLKGSDHMDHMKAYNSNVSNEWDEYKWNAETNQNDIIHHVDHYEHINNFNSGDNNNTPGTCGNGKEHKGTTLMENMGKDGITASNQFGFDESYGTDPKFYNNYIILKYKGYWFVGFDYEMHKNNIQTHNHGEALDVERDWNFTDWIVRITPAYHAGETPDEPIGTPLFPDPYDDPENGDTGDDNDDDDNGDDNGGDDNEGDETPDNPGDVTPDNPGDGDNSDDNTGNTPGDNDTNNTPVYHNNEVEVNYAILDDHHYSSGIADLVTKLSIHVRYATNVYIKIPIPTKYLVESDDLYIFNDHANGVYGGASLLEENTDTSKEFPIEGHTVTLHVNFIEGDSQHPEGYIYVWTEGINDEVINACWEYNQDGLNFEIYNYFQTEKVAWNEDDELATVVPASDLNREALIQAMNASEIEFENQPDYYINAFGYKYVNGVATSDKHPEHAIVKPASGEGYMAPYTQHHLNSTPYNDIYVHSLATADHLHKQQ